MTQISELRILPAFGIARLGSSPDPMVNYDAVVDPGNPLAPRRLVGAGTLIVNPSTGSIRKEVLRPRVVFRDHQGRIRPVAPFFEVWARIGEFLVPLTRQRLRASGFSLSDLTWTVTTANLKIWRRTRDKRDRIVATIGPLSDHRVHRLRGRCANFLAGTEMPLGHVQFIRPTTRFPEIRLRFTPPKGLLYGAVSRVGRARVTKLYDSRRGSWRGRSSSPPPGGTEPGGTFAVHEVHGRFVSRGLIDDVSDGLIEVQLRSATSPARSLRAVARVAVAPPTFAPDSFPVRTIADEIEQAWLGPDVDGTATADRDSAPDLAARAEEIVRRAAETVRLMNVAAMNGPSDPDATTTMPAHDNSSYDRLYEPVMAPALADTLAILALHQSILTALKSGTAPWFTDALRRFDEIGDLTDVARRKMPALMRGSDGRYLALTRRQADLIRTAALRCSPRAVPDLPDRKQ